MNRLINCRCSVLFVRNFFVSIAFFLFINTNVGAQDNPFEPGWALKPDASTLRFQSVKKRTKVETSSFATLSGNIDSSGTATVKILLDSVDTKVDLRNVRMRFLFFETFKFPEATVSVSLEPSILADLPEVRRKTITLPYTLDLHGFGKELEADLTVTQISDDLISVATSSPISLSVSDFGLDLGIKKLEEAADVTILPSATVTFDFLFVRQGNDTGGAIEPSTAPAASTALETQGDFSEEACKGRFEILSKTGNIYFKFGSAQLDSESTLVLDTILDVIRRCPGLVVEVSGHTDADGSAGGNQILSEKRADSVKGFLTSNGIEPDRIVSKGYGESKPVAPNDTIENKLLNRRIEFMVVE